VVYSVVVQNRMTVKISGKAGLNSRSPHAPLRHRLPLERARKPASDFFWHIPVVDLNQFIQAIHRYDHEPVLRYSQRLRLIELANRLGIRRFDANLIIASVERERGVPAPSPSNSSPRLTAWTIAIAFQLLFITGTWWMLAAR